MKRALIPAVLFMASVFGADNVMAAIATDVDTVATVPGDGGLCSDVTSSSFSTAQANELLLVFISSNDTGGATVVTGAGLSWWLVKRFTNAAGNGLVEVWSAYATLQLNNVTVTARRYCGTGGFYDMFMDVVSFTGAREVIGAKNTAASGGGLPTITLTTTGNNSWVWAVGEDWTYENTHTAGASQTITQKWDSAHPTGNESVQWVQKQNSTTTSPGTSVTINDTAPAGDAFIMIEVEILASAPGPVKIRSGRIRSGQIR